MKKDTMKMRREWVNELLNILDDFETKAETDGESDLMWEVLKIVRYSIDIEEQGGNVLFFSAPQATGEAGNSIIPQVTTFVKRFLRKKYFYFFPDTY